MHWASRNPMVSFVVAVAVPVVACACAAPPTAQPEGQTSSDQTVAARGRPTKRPSPAGASSASGDADPVAPASPGVTSAFDCSGAGIAAFADKLANAAQQKCMSDGQGTVTNTNYDCMKDPIYNLAPPFPDAAYERLTYWAQNGNNFSGRTELFQCVDFAFVVTAGVCGTPVDAGDANIGPGMQMERYQWMRSGDADPLPGDVLVTPYHIAITAEVLDANDIRIAEANDLDSDGNDAFGEDTGVISNSRVAALDDSDIQGWYRLK
jgi:hypothetical protein